MPGTTGTAQFLRQTARLIVLIAVGLAATVHPATSKKAGPEPQSASLPSGREADEVTPDFDALLPPDITLIKRVGRGDTLMALLVKAGADRGEANDAVVALRKVYNPRGLAPGEEVTMTFERLHRYATGQLLVVELSAGTDYTVRVERVDDDSFKATKVKKDLSHALVHATGAIDSSFYLAGTKAGLTPELLAELIRIFSWDVDFQRDVHPGDSFDVLYQRVTDADGAFVRLGDILYASLTLSGVRHAVYRFQPQGGTADYYDTKGESVRKALLRTPLDAIKISSPFGNRMHPILGYTRMHRGVDFAAPVGTPIYAAGSGTVAMAGRNGGYGNYVRLHHEGRYDTAYGHMTRVAPGLRAGQRVRQGQVIGYVGATGEATGPHLHYEVLVSGQQVNPLGVKMANGQVLAGRELRAYTAARGGIDRLVAGLPPTTTVSRR
jgi:murein DD-endopeptidase MepM/ murein hydrolase activator NlpD